MASPFDLFRVYPRIETSLRMIDRDDFDDDNQSPSGPIYRHGFQVTIQYGDS